MSDNTILGSATGAACKTNFMDGLKSLNDTIFLCKGILILVPVVNWFAWIWEFIIKSQMKVVEAQYLCWGAEQPAEAEKVSVAYEKFKNYVEYTDAMSMHAYGWLVQAILILAFAEDWQGYVAAATGGAVPASG